MRYRIPEEIGAIDMHNHVVAGADGQLDIDDTEKLLEGTAKLGIDRIGVSVPLMHQCTPEEFRQANDVTIAAMKFSPRFIGFCFVHPGYVEEAVAEIRRCVVEHGMAGVKLYHQHLICDPVLRPVMELAAELGVPVLMHAGKCTDPLTIAQQPRLSHAGHFRRALEMFPDTVLIQAHIGGGGDWEWNLRELEGINSDNYYIDTGGSVIDAGIIRRTIAAVGVRRVLFSTDMSLEEGVAKLFSAAPTRSELRLICWQNFERILSMRKGQ